MPNKGTFTNLLKRKNLHPVDISSTTYLPISSCQYSECPQRSKTASLNLTYSIVDIIDIFSLFFCMIADEDVDGIATTIGTIPILRQLMDWVGGCSKIKSTFFLISLTLTFERVIKKCLNLTFKVNFQPKNHLNNYIFFHFMRKFLLLTFFW